MKKSIAVSFLFMFMVAIASPIVANDAIQEPQKTEKKCCNKEAKKECCSKEKKECCSKEKKAECKKECSKGEKK